MPMTLAHPAAVLPLRRLGLPMSALVLGSMVPDIPVFLGRQGVYGFTHGWQGVLTVDLAAVVVGLVLWFSVVRDPVVDLAPARVRNRLPERARLDRRAWVLVPVASVVGSATHVAWDAFTHADVWGTDHIAWLREAHWGLEGYRWAQYVSGVLGLAVVAVAAVNHLRATPVLRDTSAPRALTPQALPGALALALSLGLLVAALRIPQGLVMMAFDGVVTSVLVAVAATFALAVAWQVQVRRAQV